MLPQRIGWVGVLALTGVALAWRWSIPAAPGRIAAETAPAAETSAPDWSDVDGDGFPAFLALDVAHDRRSFRRWFTFLAEALYYRPPGALPREVTDCAALLRFAYREALREHTGAWAAELGLDAPPPEASVEKYRYPFTPLGAGLFRITPGPFARGDETTAFAQFADADKLRRHNAHFLSRRLDRAQPGDLLFYRQLEQDLPFHAMIYLGPSQFEPGGNWIVYHTGPLDGGPGEIRRPEAGQLLHHPSPRWRPLAGNPNFLGVYRWNILRESD